MNIAEQYASQTGADFQEVKDRWDGRPDLLMEDIFRVRDPDTRDVRDLELFPYQRRAVHAYFYSDSSTIIVFKGRRIGMTFIFLLCGAVDALRHSKTVYPIVAQSGEDAKKRIRDLEDIFEICRLPIDPSDDDWKNIATKLILPNGSRFESFTAGSDSGRGDDPARMVLLDEMAFFPEQEDTLAAFGASSTLGSSATEVRVSTPRTTNDKFMQGFNDGTRTGYTDSDGRPVESDHPDARPVPVTIKQPTLKNPDSIDINKSLFDQDVTPVRPHLNLQKLEEDRLSDPKKFAQEYLCRPISDEYLFFGRESVERAMERSKLDDYAAGPHYQTDNTVTMGVDLAFGGHDDSVMAVFESIGDSIRKMRYFEVIDRGALRNVPKITDPDVSNGKHIAERIAQVARQMAVDHIVYDETNNKFFKKTLRQYTGRGLHPFNFSDQGAVEQMATNLNYALRNDDVTLLYSNTLKEQLLSIVKKQREDYQKPKFTGKEQSPSGKDDAAMATILAAYPSMIDSSSKTVRIEEDVSKGFDKGEIERVADGQKNPLRDRGLYGSTRVDRNRRYARRHNG